METHALQPREGRSGTGERRKGDREEREDREERKEADGGESD